MKKFEYSDLSLNKANENAIVYQFSNGEVREITIDDFGGNEEAFRTWKRISDSDYEERHNHLRRISDKDVSINGIDETVLCASPSMEDDFIGNEDRESFSRVMNKFLESLTEVQLRRFILYALYDKTEEEIAVIEKVSQQSISLSLISIEKKFDKFFKKYSKTPCKNNDFFVLSERINFYEWCRKHYSENK